jgi:plasmid stabilization system protein ParE
VSETFSVRSYEFEPEAKAEFSAEVEYLRGKDLDLAADFFAEVHAGVRLLLQHPEAGPILGRSKVLRQKVLRRFRFSLIYAVEPELIRILAVTPHKKKPGYWRRRLRRK